MKQRELGGTTFRLFDEDAYIKTFEADVVFCEENSDGTYSVILDKTAFFPEGGGQPSDKGVIRTAVGGAETSVLDVRERNGEVVHITENFVPCGTVEGTIDFEVRYERMRNHSGEHLLSGFAHKLFGCTNVGFHLNDEMVTVDLDKQLSQEQLFRLEKSVNDVIAENVKIKAYYPTADKLEKLDYRSKLELTENVRVVEIGEGEKLYDRCACCAPHVASTSEIGMLIITDSINYKGGTRLTMVCGKNAYKMARLAFSNVREISSRLSAKVGEASQAVERFIRQAEDEKAKAAFFCNAYIDMKLSRTEQTDGNIVFFEPQLERNALRRLVDRAADKCGGLCVGFSGDDRNGWSYVIISRTHDLKAEAKVLNEKMNGRGGGSSQMIQGTALAPRSVLEKAFTSAPKTGLIFDMDGTLWDSSENVAASWTAKIRELGCERPDITREDVMGIMGLTMDRIADILFGDLPKDERTELLGKCCEYENEYLREHGGVLYPELEKTLIKLKEEYDLYIVSNCQSGYIEAFLDHYGFWKYFKDIECYGNNLKQKGDNIALVCERNGLEKAWYIGDIQGDYDASVKAGTGFIHASYGFGKIAQKVPAIAKFSDLTEILPKLK